MNRRLTLACIFCSTVAVILSATAVVKLISAYSSTSSLDLIDPLLHLRHRTVFLATGIGELILAWFLFSKVAILIKLWSVAWASTLFHAYHLGLLALGVKTCGCLGRAYDWLPGLAQHEQSIARGLAFCMLIGSISLLLHFRKSSPMLSTTGIPPQSGKAS